jgi:hypothetical protein
MLIRWSGWSRSSETAGVIYTVQTNAPCNEVMTIIRRSYARCRQIKLDRCPFACVSYVAPCGLVACDDQTSTA